MNNFDTTGNITTPIHTSANTGRNIAIGATTAAFAALLGIGSAVVIGGSSSSAASATPAPATPAPAVAAPAEVEASPVPAEVDGEAPAQVDIDPIVTTESAPVDIDVAPVAEAAAPVEAPAPAPTSVNDGPCPTYNATNNLPLQLCDKGDWVSDVQRLLAPFADVATDGYFGPQTENAVEFMQGLWGFEQNGIVTQELIDVISKIDPSCNADGSMCGGDDWHGEGVDAAGHDLSLDVDGDGWVSDYERDFPFDAYCDHVLAVASSSAGQIEFSAQDVADCTSWFNHFDD